MQKLFAPTFIELGKEIGRLTTFLETLDQERVIDGSVQANNSGAMSDHVETFRLLGLRMCVMKAEEMVADLKSGMKIGQFKQALHELYGRMCDECKLFCMLSLNAQETSFYEPAEPYFGSDVSTKFPSTAYEIDECTK